MTGSQSDWQIKQLKKTLMADGGRGPLSRTLEALSRETDRHLLYYLMEHEVAEFSELVDVIVKLETGERPATVSDSDRRIIRTKLHHKRLPKLEDLGIIEYDQRHGSVRYRNPPPHFTEFLQLAQEMDNC